MRSFYTNGYRTEDRGNEPVDLGIAHSIAETEMAILVCFLENQEEQWIPKSCLHDDSEVYENHQNGVVVVKQWWAEKQGLV